MNYFITTLMKNLFTNKYNFPTFEETVSELFKINLEKSIIVYTYATCISLKRDTVAKEAVHIGVDITVEDTKEILGYMITSNESAEL